MLYVHHEFSHDKFNENYDRIYRLEAESYGKLPPVIGDYLKDRVPEIEKIVRLGDGYQPYVSYTPPDDPEAMREVQIYRYWADSTTFDVFTFPLIRGDPETTLVDPFSVVLSRSTAMNLFGDRNPVGEIVVCGKVEFQVTGIFTDIKKFHIEIDALFSSTSIEKMFPERDLNEAAGNSWLWSGTYLLLNKNADPVQVEEKINNILAEINDGSLINIIFDGFHLHPLNDIYFNGSTANLQYGKQGNLKLVQTFMVIAIFILALACINYINLTTAKAIIRTKEIAMKKVVGSSKTLLRYQFIIESVLITVISFLIAITLVQGLLPRFNQIAMIDISMSDYHDPIFWLSSILIVLLLGVISGLYPALYLTNIKFTSLIKGDTIKGSKGAILRRSLLTFQFSISILLIIAIITNLRQLHYARNMDLGFNKEHVITISTPGMSNFIEGQIRRENIREKLLHNPDIQLVSFTCGSLGKQLPISGALEIEGEIITCNWLPIDPDYLELIGIELLEGRNYSWDIEGDCMWDLNKNWRKENHTFRLLFNETAIKEFWSESPLDKILIGNLQGLGDFKYEVIGIVKDFHYRSVHHKIEPVFFIWNWLQHLMCIKIFSSDIPSTIQFIENEWKKVYADVPFRYSFLDETFDQQYKNDEQGAKIIGYFTGLAIIIACMGLYALSSFVVARRTKEIGIRKTMGASTGRIFLILSLDFVKWILLSAVITLPIAGLIMNKWLQSFAYHTNLEADIFILAIVIALVIAMLTVVWQSLKTALANPVEALRYE
jgi:putative ABC transport system permease protein